MNKSEIKVLGTTIVLDKDYPGLKAIINYQEPNISYIAQHFEKAVQQGEFKKLLEHLTTVYMTDSKRFEQRTQSEEIFIYSDEYIKLTIGLSDVNQLVYKNHKLSTESDLPISNNRRATLTSVMSERPIHVSKFAFDPKNSLEVFESDIPLVHKETLTLQTDEVHIAMPDNTIHLFEDTQGDTLWTSLTFVKEKAPLVWLFDTKTMRSMKGISPDDEATRQELLIELLNRLNYSGATDFLSELSELSEYHFVRWKALTTLLRLDTAKGIEALKKATNDNHPHVNKAAVTTYQNFVSAGLV
ncbi:HEAT repeat domain-containing protein [Colwellia sp. 6M3]|uniref:HEAT repeat domain-containing protein n=1 Tax=Colwellia sp. 6M3 TaxID=2759849 RepID=UPI0015F50464|nr:HEAT repeat domain-containing protein [Colwellia sp. 6M3]MBA6417589.1 HEAT repeat domain-containing protein [Colwellia sp. 6M3]|tara:strand:- start:20036 stop:20935 length:900 start_codon:yes stop_codon:yes gene_type:complete